MESSAQRCESQLESASLGKPTSFPRIKFEPEFIYQQDFFPADRQQIAKKQAAFTTSIHPKKMY